MSQTLVCSQCGHTNEIQRIYCHNCGVKLDRSVLPPEKTFEETQEEVQKRVQRMVKPKRGFWVGAWKTALECVASAVLVAAGIQICRTPDEVPPPPPKGEMVEKPMISLRLNQAMMEPTIQEVRIGEAMANDYLRATLKPQKASFYDEFKFLRLLVRFKEGACQFTSVQSAWDFPFYFRASYRLQIVDNKVVAICDSGSLGRLPVHPLIMRYADLVLQPLCWDRLSSECKLIDQLQAIRVLEKEIDLVTKPRRF